jgi:large subunit ribosomal protein L4e
MAAAIKKPEKAEKLAKSSKKASVLSVKGQHKSDVALPAAFDTEYRPDLILRAFASEQSWEKQPYGSDPKAGFRTTAEYYGRRRDAYRMTMNKGMSRLPRQKLPGGGLGEVRRVPHSKGGHRAHPPKAERIWAKKMNGKEWALAFKSAIAATADLELAKAEGRSHAVEKVKLPLIIENSFEALKKTKDIEDVFGQLGLTADVERAGETKTKAGKARTGKRKFGKSVLVVVSGDCAVQKAAENLAGVDVISAGDLTVNDLAPGGHAGRLTLWTESSLEKLSH